MAEVKREGNTLLIKEMVQADLGEAKKGDLCITGVLVIARSEATWSAKALWRMDYQYVVRLLGPPESFGGLAMTILTFCKGLTVNL
jgi:hypothetical protein